MQRLPLTNAMCILAILSSRLLFPDRLRWHGQAGMLGERGDMFWEDREVMGKPSGRSPDLSSGRMWERTDLTPSAPIPNPFGLVGT